MNRVNFLKYLGYYSAFIAALPLLPRTLRNRTKTLPAFKEGWLFIRGHCRCGGGLGDKEFAYWFNYKYLISRMEVDSFDSQYGIGDPYMSLDMGDLISVPPEAISGPIIDSMQYFEKLPFHILPEAPVISMAQNIGSFRLRDC